MHTALQWLIHFGSTRAIQVWHSLKRVCPDVHQSLAKADDFGSALLAAPTPFDARGYGTDAST